MRMPDAGDLPTAGAVLISAAYQPGWTGPTYMAGWFRFPDADGDITGISNLMMHRSSGGHSRMGFLTTATGGDFLQLILSGDGSTSVIDSWPSPFAGALWHWIEAFFDPLFELGGSTVEDRAKMYADFAPLTANSLSPSNPASIFNCTGAARIGATIGGGGSVDRFDWSIWIEANGIPSLANRVHLRNYRCPVAQDWSLLAA